MKPRMTSVIALVLAMALAVMPAAGAAEPEMYEITLTDLKLAPSGQDPIELGLSARLGCGLGEDGQNLLTFALAGTQDIASVMMAIEPGGERMRMGVKGISSALEFKAEDILAETQDDPQMQLIERASAAFAMIVERIELSAELLRRYLDEPEAMQALDQKELAAHIQEGIYTPAVSESVQILDKQLPAQRYDFRLDARQLDRAAQISAETDPLYRSIFELDAKINSLIEDEEYTLEHYYAAKHDGDQFVRQGSVWFCEDGRSQMQDYRQRYAQKQGPVDVMVEEHYRQAVDFGEKGVRLYYAFDGPQDGINAHEEYTVELGAPLDGSDLRVTYSLQGSPEKEITDMPNVIGNTIAFELRAGRVSLETLTTNTWEDGCENQLAVRFEGSTAAQPLAGEASFITREHVPGEEDREQGVTFDLKAVPCQWPQAELDALWARPAVDAMNMTDEERQKMDMEMQTLSIVATGALLSTPGVAQFMSQMTMAERQAYEQMMKEQNREPKLDA